MTKKPAKDDPSQGKLFGSLYEEDFLLRTLGDVVRSADVALSELVANAWDAGASKVDVTVPERDARRRLLVVEDDGTGLNEQQFHDRWMTLAYDRISHQGAKAEFPEGRTGNRRAYGRNGQGRHGLLCFGDSYRVETRRDGREFVFDVRSSKGEQPFVASQVRIDSRKGSGTKLSVDVTRNLPDPDRVRQVLSSKFLHDPGFTVAVNGTSLDLIELAGFTAQRAVTVIDPETGRELSLDVYVIEGDSGRMKHQSGVAFWVGGRLVGTPGWLVMGVPYIDGRTRAGRRTTVIVKTDDLHNEVNADWTGFQRSALTDLVGAEVIKTISEVLKETFATRVRETTAEVLTEHAAAIQSLSPGERVEIAEVTQAMAARDPLISAEALDAAVSGIIDVKQKAAPLGLIQKILSLPEEDQEGLARLLDEWSVRDALTVLDEISRRIKVVEALEKLMAEKDVDEVQILHPLVTQARWLFGPEYDSLHYSSNSGLRAAVHKVFGVPLPKDAFVNARKRPDLLVLGDGTLSAVAAEDLDPDTGIARFRRVLLVELKRGGFTIGRKEMDQAVGYAEDLLNCGLLDGGPSINAFVVGHQVDSKTTSRRELGDDRKVRIEAVTYSQLVRTANGRLFKLRDNVGQRYPETGLDLIQRLETDRSEADQLDLPSVPAALREVCSDAESELDPA